jgi:hypothetical protein
MGIAAKTVTAVLFDLGDTLWHSLVLCGMNPAASTKLRVSTLSVLLSPDDHKASATFESGTLQP